MSLPSNPSYSFIARNPHLYGTAKSAVGIPISKPAKRLRQNPKPLLNKLEGEALAILEARYPGIKIHQQAWRVKIGNGAWFKVDLCAFVESHWHCWEVKGPKQGKNVDRGLLALKCAAHAFPEVRWLLAWKQNGQWCEQEVLP